MNYAAQIYQLLVRLANAALRSEEDRLWDAWLDLDREREPRDLESLLASDVRKEFKARALVVLLAPDLRILLFRWDDKDYSLRNYLRTGSFKLKTIPQNLVSLAGELVCQNIDYALGQHDERVRESLSKYNELILQFLAVLPEDDELAERLFSRYQINDPVAYMNMEERFDYDPLLDIFSAADVPTKWKRLADKQMRDRIIAEVEGGEQFRENWRVVLQRYADHIQMSNYEGQEGYSRELLASQIRFITELPGIEDYNRELFSDWQVLHIMEAIPGDDLRETRHKLARLVVLRKTKHSGFSIWNAKSRRAADLMLREFGEEDQELSSRLNTIIAETNRREAENAEAQRIQQEKADELFRQMR